MRVLSIVAVVVVLGGCYPETLRYTLIIESEPAGARVYDPRTDEQIGTTPMEVPVEYGKTGLWTYTRRQSDLDRYTAQDPFQRSTEVDVNRVDRARVIVAAPGHERLEQAVEWKVTPIDGQTIRRRLYLKPQGATLRPEDDVFR